MEADRSALPGERVAWRESEAAPLIGLAVHQLRDERRRGRVSASIGPGRIILYTKADLLDYLATRRWASPDGD
jgi:hypothetical protein